MNCGKCPRHQSCMNRKFPVNKIYKALSALKTIVADTNESCQSSKITYQKYTHLILSLEDSITGVYGCRKFTSQHLAQVLILIGLIPHPVLGTMAMVADLAETYKRLIK